MNGVAAFPLPHNHIAGRPDPLVVRTHTCDNENKADHKVLLVYMHPIKQVM